MELQSEISKQNNERRVGSVQRVIVDSRQGEYYIARSQYDSPDVDQEIMIDASTRQLRRGHFYNVRITEAEQYDLYAELTAK